MDAVWEAGSHIAWEWTAEAVAPRVIIGAIVGRVGPDVGKVRHGWRVGKHITVTSSWSENAVFGHHAGTARVGNDVDLLKVGELGSVIKQSDERVVDVVGGARRNARGSHGISPVGPIVAVPGEILTWLIPLARVGAGVKVGGNDDSAIAYDVAH